MTKRERDFSCLAFFSLCMWMDLSGSLVLFPPGSPVESYICKLALPAAVFKGYQFVEDCGLAVCSPNWASSFFVWLCVCVSGRGEGYYALQFEQNFPGSNSSVICASWLMWNFSTCCFLVDGDMWSGFCMCWDVLFGMWNNPVQLSITTSPLVLFIIKK